MKKVDTMGMERAESSAVTRRVKRRHSEEFKAQVIAACEARGASVAGVSLAHGVNANLVRKWIIKKQRGLVPIIAPGLLPVHIASATVSSAASANRRDGSPPGGAIEIDLADARIRVRAGFDTDALRDVVRVLRDTLPR
jgi:transposase-like protein